MIDYNTNYNKLVEEYRIGKDVSVLGRLVLMQFERRSLIERKRYSQNQYSNEFFLSYVEKIVGSRLIESSKHKKEIGGIILKMKNGAFVEERVIIGSENRVDVVGRKDDVDLSDEGFVSKLPKNISCLVDYHTHPNSIAIPSSGDVDAMDSMQFEIDVLYSERIPCYMVIAGKDGIHWYQSTLI